MANIAKWVYAQVALLIVQFLLGMDANLYVNVPTTITPAFWTDPSTWIIRFHMIVGTIILLVGIYLVAKSNEFKDKIETRAIRFGFFWVIVAYASGLGFLFGGANNIFSFTMAIGFLFAILAYAIVGSSVARSNRKDQYGEGLAERPHRNVSDKKNY